MIEEIKISDKRYPELLKNIFDPPQVLYVKGNLPIGKMFGVVGTRKMTARGENITKKLVRDLVKEGFIIVSGMALGIDGVAHWAAIAAGGKTVAVLGAGIELVYPPQHRALYNSIATHGAVISEFSGMTVVDRKVFPSRNRIVSGLCEAVVIPECDIRSGSLITAKLALDQGREVFAIPGSPGTDYLIEQGANAIEKGIS